MPPVRGPLGPLLLWLSAVWLGSVWAWFSSSWFCLGLLGFWAPFIHIFFLPQAPLSGSSHGASAFHFIVSLCSADGLFLLICLQVHWLFLYHLHSVIVPIKWILKFHILYFSDRIFIWFYFVISILLQRFKIIVRRFSFTSLSRIIISTLIILVC